MKLLRFFLCMIIGVYVFAPDTAYADKEFQQKILNVVKKGKKHVHTVLDEKDKILKEVRSMSEGVQGAVGDVTKVAGETMNSVSKVQKQAQDKMNAAKNLKNDPEGAFEIITAKVPSIVPDGDINNVAEMQNNFQEAYMKKPGTRKPSSKNKSTGDQASAPESEDSVETNQAVREYQKKIAALQRENFANLYSKAFSMRANLYKETSDDKEHKNTREIIQNTKEQQLNIEKRWQNIMKLEAALHEFRTIQAAILYEAGPEEEDEE